MAQPNEKPYTDVQYRGMKSIVYTQVLGTLAWMIFGNGMLLLYLKKMGFDASEVLIYVAMPNLSNAFLSMPCAYYSDCYGKKKLGGIGLTLCVLAFVGISVPGLYGPGPTARIFIVSGIVLLSGACILMSSSFFALMDPIVPKSIRGRFFGWLSFACQMAALIAGFVTPFFLGKEPPTYYYSIVFVIVTLLQIPRIFSYNAIPEIEKCQGKTGSFWSSIGDIMRLPNFMAFSCYIFFLMLAIGCCGSLFSLIEKEVLGMGDDKVVWLTNSGMFGALIGFLVIGKPIDKFGTKPIFLLCHFGFSILIFAFVGREMLGFPILYYLIVIHFLLGCIAAASAVAITTEMMALIPEKNKSMASAFNMMLYCTGAALSSVLSGWVIDMGLLKDKWVYRGFELSQYDALLIFSGAAIILMIVALGLVPSVVQKSVKMRLPLK